MMRWKIETEIQGLEKLRIIFILFSLLAATASVSLGEEDLELPVTDVKVENSVVMVRVEFETEMIEVADKLETQLARLLKLAAEKFPDSSAIRVEVSNKGEKLCILEVATYNAARYAANEIDKDELLSQVKSDLFVNFRQRLLEEQKPGDWQRFAERIIEDEPVAFSKSEEELRTSESLGESEDRKIVIPVRTAVFALGALAAALIILIVLIRRKKK